MLKNHHHHDQPSLVQLRVGKVLQVTGSRIYDHARQACEIETDRDRDAVFYVPVITLFAVKDGFLLGSVTHFDPDQPPSEIARMMRICADHIDATSLRPDIVERNYPQ